MRSPNLLKEGHRGDEQHHIAGQPRDTTSSLQNRGFEDDENIFGRTYDLEAREPSRYSELLSVFSIHA